MTDNEVMAQISRLFFANHLGIAFRVQCDSVDSILDLIKLPPAISFLSGIDGEQMLVLTTATVDVWL